MSEVLLKKLKVIQKKKLEEVAAGNVVFDEEEKVILYHGTTSRFLNQILKNGLQPRRIHGISNYDTNNPSNEDLVYLTNFMQYRYAFSTVINHRGELEEATGENYHAYDYDAYIKYYEDTGDIPIILEIEIPTSWLYFDEDIAYNQKFRDLYKSGAIKDSEIDWKISMEQYTCTSLKVIPPEFIKKVELVGYSGPENAFDNGSEYAAALSKWANGIPYKNDVMQTIFENYIKQMKDEHLGAFDLIIPEEGKEYEIWFEDYCSYWKVKEDTK